MASLLAAAVRGGRNIQPIEIFQPSRRLRDAWPYIRYAGASSGIHLTGCFPMRSTVHME